VESTTRRRDVPHEDSDAIIIGKIVGGRAYLSEDRTAVYSEYSVRVLDVLKNVADAPQRGALVSVARAGGSISFPSGKTLIQAAENQSHPGGPQSRFLLFLKYSSEANLYVIRTGYELTGSRIFCLDRVGPTRELQEYETPEQNVLWEVRKRIQAR
jgi:hypothetical protein